MKNMISITLIILMTCGSCSSVQQNSQGPYIQLTKKRCLGKCPVYDLFIYKNGTVKYNGIDNVIKKGKQKFTIPKEKLAEIEQLFSNSNFESLNWAIDKKIRDLPVTQLMFNNKMVSFQGQNIPKNIKAIILHLKRIFRRN